MRILCLLASLFYFLGAVSQDHTQKSFTVKYITETIVPDGILDEPIWEEAESAANFWEYFPIDSIQARKQSEIKMLYDETNLYIGITVYTEGKNYAIQSLKRDFRAGNSDNITLLFDTFNDGNNAFLFGTNPYGVRREGLVSGGGLDLSGFTISWDVKWRGESRIYEDYYTSELVIPLTSFKFREGENRWRFNSYRFDTQSNESSTWVRIPQNQNIFGLTFMGDMIFEKPLGRSRTPLALIPYVNTSWSNDRENSIEDTSFKVGGDAKVSVGNSMNLDITLNPDFSQVEVDDQVTNLTRFEVSLPEKRQFFIDNNDLFASFGDSRDANPFFSRRIGIAQDTAGNTIENSIIAGARLSGKLTNDLRLGFFSIQTEEDAGNEIAGNNNSMLALQHLVFSRSNIGMFFINRQSTGDPDFLAEENRYNRVAGIDYNLISADNVWSGQYYLHKSFSPGVEGRDWSAGASMRYNSRNYSGSTKWVYIGENFDSDLGFVRRTDIVKGLASFNRAFWPEDSFINTHSFGVTPVFIWRPTQDYQNTDYSIFSQWEARFRNRERLQLQWSNRYTYLFDSFDPTGSEDGLELPADTEYHYNSFQVEYQSDARRILAYGVETTVGDFYNGERFSVEGNLALRIQPKAFISMQLNYDKITLPDPYPSADIWLIAPRFELTFSKSLFLSTLVQYSNQRDNFGVNARLQWRFAPLSDLFLVYTDNYYVDRFSPRFRSVNLKFTYWLNI
ncbi:MULTISPECIES: carbohydrate binding family 9 domain-containing protein [unclassified Robiginitalea]|uniref:carbohydrate binding family 9 domain-containing protein n=1 Tax=Robiginitalea TaxID=252306 RepID=UPI00234A2EB9|nr:MULTISPECIES: DUF5916 domain-containing protein [unclassified Robiginitalea]MDC6354750.1 DUF5916 domain-containing protein [Robiginitalea sp. PM2]MDC6375016.1 DUF5916 domain-containing protein [Robiginitalea sp. SP8]